MNEFNEWIEVDEYSEKVEWALYRQLDFIISDYQSMYNQDPVTEGLEEIIYE